ncbi:unnamed protein product, partial [Meganyctiphanes norvegica]
SQCQSEQRCCYTRCELEALSVVKMWHLVLLVVFMVMACVLFVVGVIQCICCGKNNSGRSNTTQSYGHSNTVHFSGGGGHIGFGGGGGSYGGDGGSGGGGSGGGGGGGGDGGGGC